MPNDEGVNTISTLDSATVDDEGNRVLFRHGVFRLNAQAGAALSSGDVIQPSSFSLQFSRPQSQDYMAGGNDRIAEPLADGFPEPTLSLEFPTYVDDTWISAFIGATEFKMDMTFTGLNIADSYDYQLLIEIPRLVPKAPIRPSVDGASKFTGGIEFNLMKAASAPSGMSGLTNPFRISVINQRATTALA